MNEKCRYENAGPNDRGGKYRNKKSGSGNLSTNVGGWLRCVIIR